jgi:hypothetical protein
VPQGACRVSAAGNGISPALCNARIRRILDKLQENTGPAGAVDIIRRAREVSRNGRLTHDARINAFLGVFDSPEAQRYASPDLPKLIYVDFD